MKKIDREIIKDIVIDYIYDYLYQEKVIIIKADNVQISMDPNHKDDNSEPLSSLLSSASKSKSFSMKYKEREIDYCELATSDGVHHNFLNRVERLGYKKNKLSLRLLLDIIQELCDKGFLVRNQPKNNQVKLSEKGVNHYITGRSFEKIYNDNDKIRKANKTSILAIWIAGLSALVTLITALGQFIFDWRIFQ